VYTHHTHFFFYTEEVVYCFVQKLECRLFSSELLEMLLINILPTASNKSSSRWGLGVIRSYEVARESLTKEKLYAYFEKNRFIVEQ
jgi:hypothetical protein